MSATRYSRILGAVCATLASLLSPMAFAGAATPGTISHIHYMAGGIVLFSMNGTHYNIPACATVVGRFAFDATTTTGKIQLAGLLSAYNSGTPIAIVGSGNCNVWGDSETLSWFNTYD